MVCFKISWMVCLLSQSVGVRLKVDCLYLSLSWNVLGCLRVFWSALVCLKMLPRQPSVPKPSQAAVGFHFVHVLLTKTSLCGFAAKTKSLLTFYYIDCENVFTSFC